MEVNRSTIMTTNETIFEEIKATGIITEKQISLLKRRSNQNQKDIFDYDLLDSMPVRMTPEQGEKGLTWLKRFVKKGVYGYRELEIINSSKPEDFEFNGFYDAGNAYYHHYLPIFYLNGMEYVPLTEPYIIG